MISDEYEYKLISLRNKKLQVGMQGDPYWWPKHKVGM